MNSNVILTVQEKLYERLSNHHTLIGRVVRLFEDLQVGQEMPYIALGAINSTEYGTKGTGEEILQNLEIYGVSKGEIGDIVYEIQKALEEDLVIPNYDCHMSRMQSLEMLDQVSEHYHGRIIIKLKITEVL